MRKEIGKEIGKEFGKEFEKEKRQKNTKSLKRSAFSAVIGKAVIPVMVGAVLLASPIAVNAAPSKGLPGTNPGLSAQEQAAQAAAAAAEALKAQAAREAALKAQQEAALRAQQEAALKAQQEAALKAQQEAALKAQQEAALKAQQEAALKAQQEAALKAQQEAALKAQQEAALKAQQEAALKAQQEAALKAKQAALEAETAKKLAEEQAKAQAAEAEKASQMQKAQALAQVSGDLSAGALNNLKITYKVGDERVPLSTEMLVGMVIFDGAGRVTYNRDGSVNVNTQAVTDFLTSVLGPFNTRTISRLVPMQSTTQQNIDNDTATAVGYLIHINYERDFIKKLIKAFYKKDANYYATLLTDGNNKLNVIDDAHNGSTEVVLERSPKMVSRGFFPGRESIGETYIEVNVTEQYMYYYENGVLIVDTDIVSGGAPHRSTPTPSGLYSVKNKARNTVLTGPGYASFVNMWMGYHGGYGIHDAPWRSEFGGDINTYNGSHGCTNTPFDKMSVIYERAQVGIPVVVY